MSDGKWYVPTQLRAILLIFFLIFFFHEISWGSRNLLAISYALPRYRVVHLQSHVSLSATDRADD